MPGPLEVLGCAWGSGLCVLHCLFRAYFLICPVRSCSTMCFLYSKAKAIPTSVTLSRWKFPGCWLVMFPEEVVLPEELQPLCVSRPPYRIRSARETLFLRCKVDLGRHCALNTVHLSISLYTSHIVLGLYPLIQFLLPRGIVTGPQSTCVWRRKRKEKVQKEISKLRRLRKEGRQGRKRKEEKEEGRKEVGYKSSKWETVSSRSYTVVSWWIRWASSGVLTFHSPQWLAH